VAPTFDVGQVAVDQPLDDTLNTVWQVRLDGDIVDTRLVSVAGAAVLVCPIHGIVALGADPPDLRVAEGRPVLEYAGPSYPGQLLAMDQSGAVYRVTPGRAPVRVWQRDDERDSDWWVAFDGWTGLPGGRLLASVVEDTWSSTRLIEEADGKVLWRTDHALAPELPLGDRLIAGAGGDLVSLDAHTGEEVWRRPRVLSVLAMIGVVGDLVWITDSLRNRLAAFQVDSGRPAATVELPRKSRMTGLVDQAGRFHVGDEHGWLVVDLARARLTADVRFEHDGIGGVYANRTLRSADGRLVLADDRGQVFVAHPGDPHALRHVATFPGIKDIGIAAGRLIVLSRDGVLTALGAPAAY
jgi:hypothetical protein